MTRPAVDRLRPADRALWVRCTKALLDAGVPGASIPSLFEAIQTPAVGLPWRWLRSPQARDDGAALVLVLGHPLGPDPARTGHAYLTTAHEAKAWLLSKQRVIVIDVGAMIQEVEEHTGRRYDDADAGMKAR